ncbi:phosphomannomutase [Palleronia sp. KMU-117]|uniref:phosphomannomutase n=1 Tax=Palleronia sp. KMU-117 TaxID=3434108 RepID=UPI003D74F48A
MKLDCFKAYDVRGRLGETLDPSIARRIGRAFAARLQPGTVVVGHDARASSPSLKASLIDGLRERGADVVDIGLCGTEEVYFATAHLGAGGGIMVTASHNPIDYNGMKLVGPGSRPIDPATELAEIRALAEADAYADARVPGKFSHGKTREAYAAHVAGMADAGRIRGLRVLANAGNGTAGAAFDAILANLTAQGADIVVQRVFHDPDPSFPNGIPNPLLPENRGVTAKAVRDFGADLGLAWDGDFDRCFFFDETGAFIDGEYVVALLAQAALADEPGATIVHDPRVIWATTETVAAAGGEAVVSKTGHAYLKSRMRETGAVYGGEMSAHHYFRDFFFCDSGMVPAVRIIALIAAEGRPLSSLVADLRRRFPSSGEINFTVPDPIAAVEAMVVRLRDGAISVDRLDGASLDFGDWRMNLRASNTEPLLRLNIETRGDAELLTRKLDEVRQMIEGQV